MTVGELKKLLESVPDHLEVHYRKTDGHDTGTGTWIESEWTEAAEKAEVVFEDYKRSGKQVLVIKPY